jgi:hypothetical protein
MKEIFLYILDKLKLSYKLRTIFILTFGILLITLVLNAIAGNWIIVLLGIVTKEFLNKPITDYEFIIINLFTIIGFYCIYHAINALNIIKHDRLKFEEFKSIVDINKTKNILHQIKTDFCFNSEQNRQLYNIQCFLEQPENSFSINIISVNAKELRNQLNEYLTFRVNNFFLYPSNQTMLIPSFFLQPSLDNNKELLLYDQNKSERLENIRKELVQKTENIESTLTLFISISKSKISF